MSDPRFNSTKAQAFQLFKNNQLDMARVLYDQIAQNDPTDFDSHFMLGIISHRSGDNDQAIEQLNAAIKIRENAPGALCQLAIIYHNVGDNASAIALLKRAVAAKPDYYDAYMTLIKVLSIEELYSDIILYCDEAIKAMPDKLEFSRHRETASGLIDK